MASQAAQQEAILRARHAARFDLEQRFGYVKEAIESAVLVIETVADESTKKGGIEVILAGFEVMLEALAKDKDVK